MGSDGGQRFSTIASPVLNPLKEVELHKCAAKALLNFFKFDYFTVK
jgi:hypothetical protein